MVHATWDGWFVRSEVEGSDPEGLSVWYLGCNGFVVRSAETTIYIDPYFGDGNPPTLVRMIPVPMDPGDATACDAVFVTHEHIDHMHPPSYGPLVNDLDAPLYAPPASYTDLDYDGDLRVPGENKNEVGVGDAIEVGDLTVHVRASNDPDAVEPVSYVIEHEAGTLFHGGDSKPAAAFEAIGAEFDIDAGVLAFGSRGEIPYPDEDRVERVSWYMDENQAIEAANDLELPRLLPSHWDMWNGVGADRKALFEHARSHRYPEVVDPIVIGDRVDVGRSGIVRPSALREDT